MICEACGLEMAFIRGGISKKTGNKFDSFYSCQCGNTYNPPKENLQVKPTVSKPTVSLPQVATNKDTYVEGKKENTHIMCKTDLMVALVNKWGETAGTDLLKAMFDDLWGKVAE